jgi:hypothetical protein
MSSYLERVESVSAMTVNPFSRSPDQNSATPNDASSALTTFTWMSCTTGDREGVPFVMQRGSRARGAFASAKTPASMPVAGLAKARIAQRRHPRRPAGRGLPIQPPRGARRGGRDARRTAARQTAIWTWVACGLLLAVAVVAGRILAQPLSDDVVSVVLGFAGGAVLASLADTVMPEAFDSGGPLVALATTAGFFISCMLAA